MNKYLSVFFLLIFVSSCNPLAKKTKIDSEFKPGLPVTTEVTPPVPSAGMSDFRVTPMSGSSTGNQVRADLEISTTEESLTGTQFKGVISIDTTIVR
jgi:hypothetical protein